MHTYKDKVKNVVEKKLFNEESNWNSFYHEHYNKIRKEKCRAYRYYFGIKKDMHIINEKYLEILLCLLLKNDH